MGVLGLGQLTQKMRIAKNLEVSTALNAVKKAMRGSTVSPAPFTAVIAASATIGTTWI